MPNPINSAILTRFEDALGKWREAPPETIAAIEASMGMSPLEPEEPVLVVRCGQRQPLHRPAQITLEDGAVLSVDGALPADLPAGYHNLRYLDRDRDTMLIVSPGVCYFPEGLRIWGWSAQLYALRSSGSWGIGDFADLRQLGHWSARELGARILLVSPLQATLPVVPQEPSPYFPSSRTFLNPLYLRIEEVPGAAALSDLQRFTAIGEQLNHERRIDRDAVFKVKMRALEFLWARFGGDARFERFCHDQGEPLAQFATFCVLVEELGKGWRKWPTVYSNYKSPGVARFADHHASRVRFHQWLQWLLDEQRAGAAAEIPLMQDLPIGVDPEGAETWVWQGVFAEGVTVGSPPDEYNTQGQNWGFSPLVPWKLRALRYEPFIQSLRGALRHAGGLRIDHVMGLFRLFWIPQGAEPSAGTYVRYPIDDLLAILALESQRAKAYIVGEDLGTVEEGARTKLASSKILSYRLVWFEANPPSKYPDLALAAVTTHDLPTIAGLWTGQDLKAQHRLGLQPNEKGTLGIRERLRAMTDLHNDAAIEEVIKRAHGLLAHSPAAIVAATLEDALAVQERPNMPGAPACSWSLALPVQLEDIQSHPLASAVAKQLRERP
jgi:4-alpha-glucanotransferase